MIIMSKNVINETNYFVCRLKSINKNRLVKAILKLERCGGLQLRSIDMFIIRNLIFFF